MIDGVLVITPSAWGSTHTCCRLSATHFKTSITIAVICLVSLLGVSCCKSGTNKHLEKHFMPYRPVRLLFFTRRASARFPFSLKRLFGFHQWAKSSPSNLHGLLGVDIGPIPSSPFDNDDGKVQVPAFQPDGQGRPRSPCSGAVLYWACVLHRNQ